MRILLDTHAFVWLASDSKRIPAKARRRIRGSAGEIYLSAISAMEIGILVHRRRLKLPMAAAAYVERAMTHHGIEEIPVTWQIAMGATDLPNIHNDPYDRIILATARRETLKVISMDETFSRYPEVEVLWE